MATALQTHMSVRYLWWQLISLRRLTRIPERRI